MERKIKKIKSVSYYKQFNSIRSMRRKKEKVIYIYERVEEVELCHVMNDCYNFSYDATLLIGTTGGKVFLEFSFK